MVDDPNIGREALDQFTASMGQTSEQVNKAKEAVDDYNAALAAVSNASTMSKERLEQLRRNLIAGIKPGEDNAVVNRALIATNIQLSKITRRSVGIYAEQSQAISQAANAVAAFGKRGQQLGIALSAAAGAKGVGTAFATISRTVPAFSAMTSAISSAGPVALIGAFLMNALFKTIKGGADVQRVFMDTMDRNVGTTGRSIDVFSRLSLAAARAGASVEEAQQVFSGMARSYAYGSLQMKGSKQAQRDYMGEAAKSIGIATGLGKALDFSNEALSTFLSSMSLMQGTAVGVDVAFGAARVAAQKAKITVTDFASIISTIAPSSMLANRSLQKAQAMIVGLGDAIEAANGPIIQAVKNMGQMKVVAGAMKQFADMSNKMDVGKLLAVVGGVGGGAGSLPDLLKNATQAFQPGAMLEYLQMISEGAGSQKDATAAVQVALTQMGMGLKEAGVIAEAYPDMLARIRDAEARKDAVGKREAEKELQYMLNTARNTSAMRDPIRYIATLMERLVGLAAGFVAGGGVQNTMLRWAMGHSGASPSAMVPAGE